MLNRNFVRLFESRKGHLDYRVKRDYLRNGIVSIPCHISSYSDVISTYSVKDYETLNPDFFDYLKTTAEVTPSEYPLVLNIIEDCLSEEEKVTIDEIIRDDLAYNLGIVEKEVKRHSQIFWLMFTGLLVSGIILWLTETMAVVPRELLFIMFWFMGETVCDYILLTGHDLRRDRRLAGRLASIKVVFSESYEETEYTKSDVDKLYAEIEKDVKETIREDV
jgi:hypothetical protein